MSNLMCIIFARLSLFSFPLFCFSTFEILAKNYKFLVKIMCICCFFEIKYEREFVCFVRSL
eukprot:UN02759